MFDISKVHDISILHLYGEISLLEMDFIQKVFESLKKCQHNKILIDLARVDHVHFQAVKHWASEALRLREGDGDLKVVGANVKTKQMMQFTGADQCLRDYSSIGDAILSFLRAPVPEVESQSSSVSKRSELLVH